MMMKAFTLFMFISAAAAQIYVSNDVMFDYPEDLPMQYAPVFESYPDILPDYRVMAYPPQSYSQQMWTGCGCAKAKTYGDYMRTRSRSRDQRMFSYYQMM